MFDFIIKILSTIQETWERKMAEWVAPLHNGPTVDKLLKFSKVIDLHDAMAGNRDSPPASLKSIPYIQDRLIGEGARKGHVARAPL